MAGAGRRFLGRRGQQRVGRRPSEHVVELPRQVGGVADAGAHALPGEGGNLVGRVAGQQDASARHTLGVAGGEGVHGAPFDGGVVGPDVPRLEQLTPGFELVAGLLMEAHELPPPPSRSSETTVVGLAGSQICPLVGSNTLSSCRMTSTMSQS